MGQNEGQVKTDIQVKAISWMEEDSNTYTL
jgi:hypothetical protein